MELTGRQIRISVRNLVEFVLRSGDIDNRRTAGAQKEAMLAGGRMHRKIQRRMGSGYQAEVSLRHSVEEDGFQIVVEGRADGIIRDGKDVTIDEIKCVYQDVNCLEEAVGVHMAQARCYGYIYGLQEALDEVTLQLTYCNLETEEIRRFQEIQTMNELSEWFAGLIHMSNGRVTSITTGCDVMNQSKRSNFPIRTGRDSGSWRWRFTGRWSAGAGCLSRPRPGLERHFRRYFRRLKRSGKGMGRNSFT